MSASAERPGDSSVRRVLRVIRGQAVSDGAGVRLTRVIGSGSLPDLDPFLLLDEFRSDQAEDYLAGFPPHPHRGFETVTYMLAGRMRHGDNQGNTGLLGPGSVQWMTAGRGIVHEEMPEQQDGLMWGFQLWVNLPSARKMTAPRYQDIPAANIPEVTVGEGVRVRVVAGEFGGTRGPVQAESTSPLYLDVNLDAGATFKAALPSAHNAFVYAYEGNAEFGPASDAQSLQRGQLGVLGPGGEVHARAAAPARFLLVAGRPLNEPVVRYGPFVMNTESQIREAIRDYQAGRL